MSSIRPSCEGDPHEGEPLRADRVVNRPLKASSLTLAFSLIWISIAWYLVNLAWQNPDQSMPHYMAEGGPLQNLQLWLLGSSLFVGCLGIWKHRGEERGVFVFLIGLCFYLFWREADWDKDYVSAWLGKEGVRMFSWRYLVAGSEFPLRLKVFLGTTSIAVVAAWLIYCWH